MGGPELFDEPGEGWRTALRRHLEALPQRSVRAGLRRLLGMFRHDLEGVVAVATERMVRERELAEREARADEQTWITSFWLEPNRGRVSFGEVHHSADRPGRIFVAEHIYRWGDRYLVTCSD